MSVLLKAMVLCRSTEHETDDATKGKVHLVTIVAQEDKYKKILDAVPFVDVKMTILDERLFTQVQPGKIYKLTLTEIIEEDVN